MLERGLRCAGVSIERSQLLLWFTVLRWAVLEWPVWRADVQVRWFELHLGFSVLRGQLHCGLLRLHCHQLQPGEQLGLPFGGRLLAPQQRDSDLRGDGLWHSGLLLLGVHPVRRWLWLLCQQLPEDLPAVDGAGLHQRLDLRRRVGMDHLRRLSVKTHRADAVPEGAGTMLDNTVVVWCSETPKGNTHSHQNAPLRTRDSTRRLGGRVGGRGRAWRLREGCGVW